ncbi:hypothetical protein NESM_000300400 [Novymonas esmeraldas]|uniref:Myb-like domain-containing protein n=1 Tax=Novymonas esmeraldas TaxID=1808958 RepID=A0AAW0FGD5_9TRYP
MDDDEFEFPPDQLDDVIPHPLSPYQTAVPSPLGPSYASPASGLPLGVLMQIPLDQLPPTQPRNPQNFSIGQAMRGALSRVQMRAPPGGGVGGGVSRPRAAVAQLPPPPRTHQVSPTHSPYLSAGHPQVPSLSSDDEERDGGAEGPYPPNEGGGEEVRGGVVLCTAEAQMRTRRFPSRQTRIDWSEGEVRSFYQALSQYGTDFSAIAVLFPGRSRSDIKRLYQREMRQKPKEVQTALNQKSPIDMAAFEVRYEAKKKETQPPIKTKTLNSQELAFLDEIAGGQGTGSAAQVKSEESDGHIPAAAALGDVEETVAAPPPQQPRKRQRDARGSDDGADGLPTKSLAHELCAMAVDSDFSMEHESLFDMAMRHERDDNTPLNALFTAQPPHQESLVGLDDTDFSFD